MPESATLETKDSRILVAIYLFCGGFIAVLLVSAYFERKVLPLHLFQSLIYVAVAWLSRRRSKWGYAIGIAISAEWNAYNLFVSHFIRAGFRQLALLFQQGRITNPVHLSGGLGGIDHLGLLVCLVWAYARLPNKRYRDLLIFAGGAVLITAYFFAIIALSWPQFLPRLKAHFLKS